MHRAQSIVANLTLGGTSGFVAATICYPLDTIRRRMQMAGHLYDSQIDAFRTIWRKARLFEFVSETSGWHEWRLLLVCWP